MKLTFERTPEQLELVAAMASRNKAVAYDAQIALAQFIGPVLAQVVQKAGVLGPLFSTLQFNADDNPSIPLDLYYDVTAEDYAKVWSQSVAGGLPRSEPIPTVSEMKIATYDITSAYAFDRKYAARHRLDVVAKSFTRLAQEILLTQERTYANLLLRALAAASTNSKAHVQKAGANSYFTLQDLSELLTLSRRILTSWEGGTPVESQGRGITDLLISPEISEKIRAMAFNPINTNSGPAGGTAGDGQMGTDDFRNAIFGSAGLPNFYGINLMEINELGVGQRFNTIFDTVAGATAFYQADGTSNGSAFTGTAMEILIGVDRTRESLIRVESVEPDQNSAFVLEVDDQYVGRQKKIGWYGEMTEGCLVLDDRALCGKIVGTVVNA